MKKGADVHCREAGKAWLPEGSRVCIGGDGNRRPCVPDPTPGDVSGRDGGDSGCYRALAVREDPGAPLQTGGPLCVQPPLPGMGRVRARVWTRRLGG